ncbi:hypothetical protein [Clostridium oceanicum]|uniref:Uncharacterized protein n=1 Tax=Clostridium oceanicum TaxID=1543 RepID=A0ABN1JRJ2_9CLOT
MIPVLHLNSDIKKAYSKDSFISKIKDRYSIIFQKENRISDLDLDIIKIKFPCNYNKKSYYNNLNKALKISKSKECIVAPNTIRLLDYRVLNSFQKNLFSYSVVESIKTILTLNKRNIKNSYIVIYDAADVINFKIIEFLSTKIKYMILVSENMKKLVSISEYIIANYGITPIITKNLENALNKADFFIYSGNEKIYKEVPIWYINNMNLNNLSMQVNSVTYKVPWDVYDIDFTPELLGGILCQMEEKDIEKSLIYNGISIDKIKYNDYVIDL